MQGIVLKWRNEKSAGEKQDEHAQGTQETGNAHGARGSEGAARGQGAAQVKAIRPWLDVPLSGRDFTQGNARCLYGLRVVGSRLWSGCLLRRGMI